MPQVGMGQLVVSAGPTGFQTCPKQCGIHFSPCESGAVFMKPTAAPVFSGRVREALFPFHYFHCTDPYPEARPPCIAPLLKRSQRPDLE